MNNNKIIIFATCFLMLLSFIFLSYAERRQADPNTKNTWAIYFENPKDSSLTFAIDNHSENTDFHWEILAGKDKLKEADAAAANGQTLNIPVSLADTAGKKITVSVSANGEKKEIYKNL